MKFPVSPTLIMYMAVSAKLPPCAGALANICRGCRMAYIWLINIIKYNPDDSNTFPALVFTPGQQDSTVTGLSGSLRYAIGFHILHLIGLCSKKLHQCPMVSNTFQSTGGYHA